MKTKILVLALLIFVVGACKQSNDMVEFLSKFKDAPLLSPELHQNPLPDKYIEISKDLLDKYLKNLEIKEFEKCKHLKFYGIERVLANADFYILSLGIEHDLIGKPQMSLILITVDSIGQVIGQTPLEGYWDKKRYDFNKMESIKIDEETKKMSGVEMSIEQSTYSDNFESYTLEGTAIKYIQKEGNILQLEFMVDEDFVEGEEIDVNAFLNQFKMVNYPVEVDHVNTPCYDGIINMRDYGYSSEEEGDFSPVFRLPDFENFHLVVMCLAGVPQEKASYSVFVVSQWGTVVSSMEIASAKQDGDDFVIKKAILYKENQLKITIKEGNAEKVINYKFNPDGSIKQIE